MTSLLLRLGVVVVAATGCAKLIGIEDYNRSDAGADMSTIDAPFGSLELYIKPTNTSAGDNFGRSVALSNDGMTLVVGAQAEDSAATGINGTQNDESALSAGAAYVLHRTGTTWAHDTYIKASNTEAADMFGIAVALSADGRTLAISAHAEDSGIAGTQSDNTAANSGAVYVFVKTGDTWTQQAYVKPSTIGANDQFGRRIAISGDGDTIAVGAALEDSIGTGINSGMQADNTSASSGAAYVFVRNGTMWSQQAYIKASNSNAADMFGAAVALSNDGNTLAVGATDESSNATGINGNQASNTAVSAGAVYVFTRAGTTWTQQAYVKASNTGAGDQLGASVALSADGNTLAAGAITEASAAKGIDGNQADDTAAAAGAVYVFTRTGTTWTQAAYVKASNTDAGDQFGVSVSLSPGGDLLAVGAHAEDSSGDGVGGDQTDNTAASAGAVYVFSNVAGTWMQTQYVKALLSDGSDQVGIDVAIVPGTLAIGAIGEASKATGVGGDGTDNTAPNSGAVYVVH